MPGPSPDANLAETLSRWTDAFGWADRVAFLCGDDLFTHGEVHRGAARVASLLLSRGVGPGDRVVIALPGSIEFVWAFLGTVRIGAVAMLADPDSAELPPASLVVSAPGRRPDGLTSAELTAAMPAAVPAAAHPVERDTPAYGQCTPTYTHGDPEEAYLAMAPLGLREDDVLFSVAKTYDPVGLRNTIFLPLFSGASAVLDSGQRSIPVVAEGVRRHRASVLFSTSAFFTHLAAEGPRGTFAPLRMAIANGATPPPRIQQWLGCPVVTP